MIRDVFLFLFPLLFLSSCIQFPVISTLTTASSLSEKEISLKLGNSARNFHLQLRKGIYREDFWGIDTGVFVSYALPDKFFRSISFSVDTKVSVFENTSNTFATGIEVNYLLSEITNQSLNFLENSINIVFPVYLESSMTEWFKFLVNFRLFFNVVSFNNDRYVYPLTSINVGFEFFKTFRMEGYLVSGKGVSSFPIPGLSLSYVFNF